MTTREKAIWSHAGRRHGWRVGGNAPRRCGDAPCGKAAHSRVLPLQGGRNFRDLGGYPAAGGRHTVWGKLFRSGSMHGLTPADYTTLEARGIRVVCDFRDVKERGAEPAHGQPPPRQGAGG
jgi:protein-tyrosine phosphatase